MIVDVDSTRDLFDGKDDAVRDIFTRIVAVLEDIGPCGIEAKKTSIHLTNGTSFAGVHPRKTYLYLNLRLDRRLEGERIAKAEQVSKHRFHNEVKLTGPEDIDGEMVSWLRDAYQLTRSRSD